MVEVVPKFPHESYNVFSLLVTGLFFYWAYNAVIRFYRAMLLRSAVITEDAVLIRGVGSNLYYFEGAWPMHAHAILHTRQAEPPKPIKSLVIPFQLKNIQWVDHRLLQFDISAMVDCAVIVLLDFNVNALRQCFGTERSNNRSFLKTRASLQSHCLKSKKNSHLDTYSAELAQILASGEFCSIGGKAEIIPSGNHSDINLPVPNVVSLQESTPPATYSPMDITGIELGESLELDSPNQLRQSSASETTKQTALLVVPNQSFKRGQSSRAAVREDSTRNPALFLSPTAGLPPAHSSDSRDRVSTSSHEAHLTESCVSLDFALLLLSPSHSQRESDVETTNAPSSAVLRVDELLIHAEGGLHSVHDVYGVPSQYSSPPSQETEEDGKSEENDCVICLTEKKDIFLLPCRHMCVCKGCFIHIDKCPVCRTPFNTYVLVQDTDPGSVGGYGSGEGVVLGPEGV